MTNCLFGIVPGDPEWILAINIAAMQARCLAPSQVNRVIPKPSCRLLEGLKAAGLVVYKESLNVLAAKELLKPGTYYKPPHNLTQYYINVHPPEPVMQLPIHGPLVSRQQL